MNRGYTIALLSSSSAPFCRSPAAGLNSVKNPSLSVLRFPAKNWYVGVASRSNNVKGGDSGNKEASVMMDDVLEAAILKVLQFWYKKFTLFAFVSALITVDGMLYVIQLLRSSFAESTVAGAKQLIAVALAVALALPIALKLRPRVIRCIKAIVEQEIKRMKVTYVGTKINEKLEALIEEDKVNPGTIDVIHPHLVKYFKERHSVMKTNDIGADTKQNKGSTKDDDAWCFRIWY